MNATTCKRRKDLYSSGLEMMGLNERDKVLAGSNRCQVPQGDQERRLGNLKKSATTVS